MRSWVLVVILAAWSLAASGAGDEQARTLMEYLGQCKLDRAQALLAQGADPNFSLQMGPNYALNAASAVCGKKCSAEALALLIEHGFDVNLAPAGARQTTPLFHCLSASDAAGSRVLMEHGADLARIETGPLKLFALGFSPAGRSADPFLAQAINKELARRGAKEVKAPEPRKPIHPDPNPEVPPPEPGGVYAPGTLVSGPCAHYGMMPDKLSCGDSGVEVFVATKIITGDWDKPIGPADGCKAVELPPLPGTYKVWTVEIRERWWVEKCYKGKVLKVGRKSSKKETSYTFQVSLPDNTREKPESGIVRIMEPVEGDQFSFDDSHPTGELVLSVLAKYAGDNTSVEFSTDSLGDSEIRIVPASNPPKGTARATIIIRGLPPSNGDFGTFTIRAKGNVAGTDSVRVKLFYDPAARNHPGHGNPLYAGTPNWFYYWSQTRAGKPVNYRYKPVLRKCDKEGRPVQGRYVHNKDTLYISDAVFNGPCARRRGGVPDAGKQSMGIDCFAEIVRHENVHRREYQSWWGPHGVRLPECEYDDIPGSLYRKFAGLDSDRDLVPDDVERRLGARGCDAHNAHSCQGRPDPELLDVEMNAYTKAWRQWRIGSSDREDWSKCGKQWRDRSVCPY